MYIVLMNLCILGSFNRYMVECELLKSVAKFCETSRFNRYMVECEYGIYL